MQKQKYSVGIIGGNGIMGKFFHSVFLRHGVTSFIWGRNHSKSLQEFCKTVDIIMVSVPIDKTEEIIKEIGNYITDSQCICDVTSVKVAPMKAMKQTNKKYFGMHPMFAPPLSGKMSGQNVVFCEGNAPEQQDFIETIFRSESAFLLYSTPKEHDEIMSLVQGLSHFLDITFIQVLQRKNINLQKIFASRSPAYALKIMLAGRTLYQNANLYGNIQIQNPANKETLTEFFDEAEKLFSIIKKKDLSSFSELFEKQKKFLGPYAETSQKESDIIIDFLANRILKKDKPVALSAMGDVGANLGILGPRNTFSHLAAQEFFGEEKPLQLYPSISGVFSAFLKKEITEIFVPLENILHGSVAESIDGICKVDLPIQGIYEMKIIPAMFCARNTQIEEITEIFSHPQSLAQCSDFLEKHYPHVHITPVSSTANAIIRMRDTAKSAAIAPESQIETEGIKKIHSSIANQNNNATRFAYLSHTPLEKKGGKSLGGVIFSLKKDTPGALEKVLNLFSQRSINLTKIESRPTGKAFGEYNFFVTYEGIIPEKKRNDFFQEVKTLTESFRFLGEFGIFYD